MKIDSTTTKEVEIYIKKKMLVPFANREGCISRVKKGVIGEE
jgi:hypothetical protein